MNPKIFVIARMGSSRLPGKVLMPLGDKTVLGMLIERMRMTIAGADIVLTTSVDPKDDPIVDFGMANDITVFRGSEADTVDRIYQAAKKNEADPIVRVTGDCPFLQPKTVDDIINRFQQNDVDYVSTDITPTYPNGMGCDAFSFSALQKIYQISKTLETDKAWEQLRSPELGFRLGTISGPVNASHYRLTIDTQEDLDLARCIADEIYSTTPNFTLEDIIKVLEKHPDWLEINAHIMQKTGPHALKSC